MQAVSAAVIQSDQQAVSAEYRRQMALPASLYDVGAADLSSYIVHHSLLVRYSVYANHIR